MSRLPESLSGLVHHIAARASVLTGVDASEIVGQLEPTHQAEGGWLVHFTGPSHQAREAVEQAIGEMGD